MFEAGSIARGARWSRERIFLISDKDARIARRDRQAKEAEENQRQLRISIANSQRLVGEADAMIKRHRDECDEAERQA